MKTWRIKNGDVLLDSTGRIEYINHTDKIIQDLRHWLLNYLGHNKFHPEIGTVLDDFLGNQMSSTLVAGVRAVVTNALNAYMTNQMSDLKDRIAERGDPYAAIGAAEPSGMVKSWSGLEVWPDYTNINIRIGFRTFTDDIGEIELAISNNVVQSG